MNRSLAPLVLMCLMLYLAGMLQVWGWAIGHLIRREPISLPRFLARQRTSPWGMGTLILVLVAYLGTNIGIIQIYLVATGRNHRVTPPAKPTAAVAITKSEPAKQTKGEVKPPQDESLPKHTAVKSADDRNPPPKIPAETASRTASPEDSLLSVTEGMFLLTLINEILIVTIPVLVRLTSGAGLRDLGLTFSGWRSQLKIGAAGALLIAPVVYLIQFYAIQIWSRNGHPVEDMIRNHFTPGVAYLAAISAVVMAPIVEEIMFRGLVQSWLFSLASRQAGKDERPDESDFGVEPPTVVISGEADSEEKTRRPAMQAIVLTSLFFAIVHSAQWPAPIPIFLLSLGLGIVYHLTGSLLASIAMHATFNSLSTLMLFLAMSANPEDLPGRELQPHPASITSSVEVQTPE